MPKKKIRTYQQRIRHVVEKCSMHSCDGTRRYDVHPTLMTYEEYDQRYNHKLEARESLANAPANAVLAYAGAGSQIFEACKEGVELAKEYDAPIAFEFNGKMVICYSWSTPEEVGRQWWQDSYGKTPEQSFAER